MEPAEPRLRRRQLLTAGSLLAAGGCGFALGSGFLLPWDARASANGAGVQGSDPARAAAHPPGGAAASRLPFDPQRSLREFDTGRLRQENGRTVREFSLEVRSVILPLGAGVVIKAWTYNGRVPGPTLRARQGERLRLTVHNADSTAHSVHLHGVHPPEMDGIEPVLRGRSTVLEFDLPHAGLYPYHCHVAPVAHHVSKGLYGLLVVDPPAPRPPADELVLVMGAYDLNSDGRNELYAFNGIPDAYLRQPIQLRQHAPVRLYLLNMTEAEAPLTFHLHGNEFEVLKAGWRERTDVITLGMAERAVLEFAYPFPGRYMLHPHQDPIAERGCMGLFDVLPA